MLLGQYPHNHPHISRIIHDTRSYNIGVQITYGILYNADGYYYGSRGTAFFSKFFEEYSSRAFTGHDWLIAKAAEQWNVENVIRGHIINSMLGGSLDTMNLVPLTPSANRLHSTYEQQIKCLLSQLTRLSMDANRDLFLGYEVEIDVDPFQYPKRMFLSAQLYSLNRNIQGNLQLDAYRNYDGRRIACTEIKLPLRKAIAIP